MSSKNLRIICIWNEDEFTIIESKNSPSKEEAYLIIDESSEKMDVHIPSKFSIVQKRIIERQAYSIAKSGFLLPKSSIRIGMGFDVTISKDDSIPETLLQVGHHYSLDKPTSPYIESSTPEFESKKMPDSNYQPSYLLYDSFST